MKTVSGFLFAILMVVVFSAQGNAQIASTTNPEKKAATVNAPAPQKFVDANKNGVCDNSEAKKATGQGKNFVDKNGDGACDNKVKCGKGNGNCCGMGQGNGNGCGKGKGQGNCGTGCRNHKGN
jgi:hypothetical protein